MKRSWLFLFRNWLVITVGVLSVFIARALDSTQIVTETEYGIEQWLQMRFAPAERTKRLVVVEITPKDIPMTPIGPARSVPRQEQAEFINLLKRAGAHVLAIDLLYDSHPQPGEDSYLRDAVLNSAPLKITMCEMPHEVPDINARNGFQYLSFARPAFLPAKLPENVELGESERVDTGDLVGSVALVCQDLSTGKYVQNLALIAFRQLHDISSDAVTVDWKESRIVVDTDVFQIGPDGDLVVDWQGDSDAYPTLGFTDALDTLRKDDPSHIFLGKVVILANSQGDPNVKTVAGSKLGFQVLASATNTLIKGGLRRPHQLGLQFAAVWTALLSLLVCFASTLRNRFKCFAAITMFAASAWLMPIAVVHFGFGILATTTPFLGVLSAIILSTAAKVAIPTTFPIPATGPLEATVMIVDIRDSTPIVDKLGPFQGGDILSKAMSLATSVIAKSGGEVIRETGDGVVAVFPARNDREHAVDAVRAALNLTSAAHQMEGVKFRVGLESGALVRSRSGLNGLPFHIAARIEAQCSVEGEPFLVGPTTAVLSRTAFAWESIGERSLKGINLPVQLFRILQSHS